MFQVSTMRVERWWGCLPRFERALCRRWSERRVGWKVCTMIGRSGAVYSVAFSRDGKWIVSGSEDTLVKIWDTETGAEVWSHGVCTL